MYIYSVYIPVYVLYILYNMYITGPSDDSCQCIKTIDCVDSSADFVSEVLD